MIVPGTIEALHAEIGRTGPMLIAFSGGVDSALLAWVASDVLGRDNAWAVTAVSPSLAPSELADCRELAQSWGLRWTPVETDEGSRPSMSRTGWTAAITARASSWTACPHSPKPRAQ